MRCSTPAPIVGGYYLGRYSACRACLLAQQRIASRKRTVSPERKAERAALAAWYRRLWPQQARDRNRAWRQRNAEKVKAWQRAYYAAHQARAQARGRANYARHADAYRTTARERYHAMTPERRAHHNEVRRAYYRRATGAALAA